MKKVFCYVCFCFFTFSLFAGEASKIASESANKGNALDSISYIESRVKSVSSDTERRALYIFLGQLYEQLSRFDSARECYVYAAGIAGGNAENMSKKSNEQLVLDAVRCALSLGDSSLADSYLNSAVRNSSDLTIQAYIKLYSQWSALCKAKDASQINDAIIMLSAYSKMSALEVVQPAILLTLWYVTGSNDWSVELKERFPKSVEAAVVFGKAQLMPSPFWFFVPRSGTAVPEIANEDIATSLATNSEISQGVGSSEVGETASNVQAVSDKPLYLQLGLFRNKDNATDLILRLKEKGFAGRILTETRPSGTTYYIVAVDENNEKTVGDELRTLGFESYPVFE